MQVDDFDFDLPPELIAQHPPACRTNSRLLHVVPQSGQLIDYRFQDLLKLVSAGDLLVFNNSRVVKARLRGKKQSGGRVELLIERILDDQNTASRRALAHIRASKSPKAGDRLEFDHDIKALVKGRLHDLFELEFDEPHSTASVMELIGETPLPPYISHRPMPGDDDRYQTVYARHSGSVAAPTAGLHFDNIFLAKLSAAGIKTAFLTLHVGAGTFQPVRGNDIAQHVMHTERYEISAEAVDAVNETKASGGRVIAVGTTSLRTLESAALERGFRPSRGETSIFIKPGFEFQIADALITNFHLPRSTLLMLVSAFVGHEIMHKAYQHAIENRYRFFSYGDAMFLERAAR